MKKFRSNSKPGITYIVSSPSHKVLVHQVRDWLSWHGWFCFPVLQSLGAYKGISDLIALKNGKTVFIEVKTSRSSGQSEHQKAFQQKVEEAGGIYWIVKSIEELEKLASED